MALGLMFLMEVVIAFSFVATTIFMFLPKNNDTVHKIFFSLAVMLAIFVTIIDATALPSNYRVQIIMAWCFLAPAGVGIIVAVAKGKPNTFSKLLVMATTVLGCLGYFFLA